MGIPTQKDANQVLRYSFDDATNSIRTLASFTGEISIELNQIDDSVAIGDGTELFTGTDVGAKHALDVNVASAVPAAGVITQAAVSVGTSAIRATVSGSAPSASRSVLTITIDPASAARFYVGSSSVTSSGAGRGLLLIAGQTVAFSNDAADYYIISDTAAQTVFIMEQA